MVKRKWIKRLVALAVGSAMLFPQMGGYVQYVSATENQQSAALGAQADENGFVIENGVLTKYTGTATEVVIPDGVTVIIWGAFDECSATSITIPDSVKEIKHEGPGMATGDSAFNGCKSLTEIKVSTGNSVYASYDGCLYNKDFTQLIEIPVAKSKVQLADGMTSINEGFGYSGNSLTSVTIPNSVTSIFLSDSQQGSDAFYHCRKLTEINVSEGNGSYASYDGCLYNKDRTQLLVVPKAKSTVQLAEGLTNIRECAFNDSSLTSIKIPDGVTSIGKYAFNWCDSLASIEIPNSVTSIGDGAFACCRSLTSITIPGNVTSIGDAFWGCSSLTEINVSAGNGSYASYDGCLYNKDCTKLLWVPRSKGNVQFADGVTYIGKNAFAGEEDGNALLTSIEIPESVTSIENEGFFGCYNLASIEIPESVTSIGEGAFWACGKLTIYGIAGSYAQTYAAENGIPFKTIEKKIILTPASYEFDGTQDLVFKFQNTVSADEISSIKSIRFELEENVQVSPLIQFTIDNYGTSYTYDLAKGELILKASAVSALVYGLGYPSVGNTYKGYMTYIAADGTEKVVYGEWYIKVLERSPDAVLQHKMTLPQGETSITSAKMQELVDINATQDVVVETAEGFVFSFAKGTMKMVSGKDTYDFGAELIQDYSQLKTPSFTKDMFAFEVKYNYEGDLPGEATIVIPAGSKWAGKDLYYYEVMEDGTLKFMTSGKVGADGGYVVVQSHCSNYVALTAAPDANGKPSADAQSTGATPLKDNPKTGDGSMAWLYVLFCVTAAAGVVLAKRRMLKED